MTPAEKLAKRLSKRRRKYPAAKIGVLRCEVRTLRDSLGLSSQAIAKACSMSIGNFNRVERGGDVQITTAKKLAKFFGKTIEELWP